MVTLLTMQECKYNLYCLLNTYRPYANILNLNHVISAKNKCPREIKIRIYPKKAVQELLFTDGLILPIATRYKPVFLKMCVLIKREYHVMDKNFILLLSMKRLGLK
jgi:hypothetical protein